MMTFRHTKIILTIIMIIIRHTKIIIPITMMMFWHIIIITIIMMMFRHTVCQFHWTPRAESSHPLLPLAQVPAL